MRYLRILLLGEMKKNMKQTIMIFTLMVLTATMLFTAFALLQNARSTIDTVLQDHETVDLMLWFDETDHNAEDLLMFFNTHEDVSKTTHNEMIFGRGVLEVNGQSVRTNELVIANIRSYDEELNRLKLVTGEDLQVNPSGLWISTAFAYGEQIEVGDTFSFVEGGETFTFDVEGIVFDPIYSSEFMPPRIWINDEVFDQVLNANGVLSHAINVKYQNPEQESVLWEEFLASLDYNYLGYEMDYDGILSAHSLLPNIIGASLLGFSIILLLVGAFVIYSVLKRTILQQTSIIGILKAQGFTSSQIRIRYIAQFVIITLCALLFSTFFGLVSVRLIGSFMMRNLGLDGRDLLVLFGASLSALFMFGAVVISALIATRRIRVIDPVSAMRNSPFNDEKTYKAKPMKWTRIFHVSVQLGLRQLRQNRGQTIFSTLLALLTAFTIFYGVAAITSLEDSFDNMAFWGEDNRDLTLTLNDQSFDNDLSLFLENEESIIGHSIFKELPAAIEVNNGASPKMLSAFVYDNFDALQVQNIEGVSPQSNDQVSISTVLAEQYQLDVGDMIDVVLFGESRTLKITGIYQTVIHMGNNIRIHKSTLQDNVVPFDTTIIRLDSSTSTKSFLLENQEIFKDLSVSAREGSDIQGVFSMLGKILTPVMLFISAIFIFIMIIILSNFVFMSIFESRRSFGIYKSFGMTTNQVRYSVLTEFLITTIIGSILGVILGMVTVPFILLQTMNAFGFLHFPFSNPIELGLLIPVILLGVVAFSIWVSTASIRHVSPRELIVE